MMKQRLALFYLRNRTLILLLLLAIFGYVSKYGFSLVLTHYLTPESFGDFNIAIRILSILSTLTLLGTNTSSKRFLSHYLFQHQGYTLIHYIQWNTSIVRRSFYFCISIAAFSIITMHALHIWHIKDIRDYHLAIYMLWLAPFAALVNLLNSYILCANYPILYTFISNSNNFVYFVFFIITVVVLDIHEVSSLHLLLTLSLGTFVLLGLSYFSIMIKAPYLYQHILSALRLRHIFKTDPKWLSVSTRLALNGVFFSFITSIDLIILKSVSPYRAHIGYYAVALTISSVLFVIPQNIYATIKAKVQILFDTPEGKKELEQRLKQPNRVTCIVGLILSTLIFCYSKTLLNHFGVSYIEADLSLKILVIGFMITTFAQPATNILAYAGFESTLLTVSFFELIFLIILGTILTYYFDIIGLAIATSITCITKTILFHIASYQRTRIKAFLL